MQEEVRVNAMNLAHTYGLGALDAPDFNAVGLHLWNTRVAEQSNDAPRGGRSPPQCGECVVVLGVVKMTHSCHI